MHLPGASWDARELVRSCGQAAWKFDNLIPEQAPFKPYLSRTEAAPIIDVAKGLAAYYAKIHVKAHQFCRELERKSRKLSREVGEVHMVVDTDAKPLSQLTVYAGTPLGLAQLARATGRQRALDTLRRHPGTRAAGRILRRTGLSSRLRDRI